MKNFQESSLGRYLLAVAAGLLLAASFPKIGIAGFAWVAPGLMLAATLGKTGAEVFRIGYVAALVHYLAMLYWLLLIPYHWHGIPLGPAAGSRRRAGTFSRNLDLARQSKMASSGRRADQG